MGTSRKGAGTILGYAAGRDDGALRPPTGNNFKSIAVLEQSVQAGSGVEIETFTIETDTFTGVSLQPGSYKVFFHVNITSGQEWSLQIRTHSSFPTTNAELRSLGSNQEGGGNANDSITTIINPTSPRKVWFCTATSGVRPGGGRFEVIRLQ